jgi:hypothetical protein
MQALAEELSSEGADVGTLADDSSNVVTLIQESYQVCYHYNLHTVIGIIIVESVTTNNNIP